MNQSEFLTSLRDKDPHLRYQALKALATDPQAVREDEVLKLATRICRRDKLAYNRLEALNALRHAWPSPEIVDAFNERLEDEAYIAEACIRILGEIGDAAAYGLLSKAFVGATSKPIRLQIIQAYSRADQPAIFDFLKVTGAHESADDEIRATIVSLLGETRNATLRSVFLKALQDTNARVRANAVEALSEVCTGKELLQILAHCVKDRNNRVKANALRSLILLGVAQAAPLLHEMAHHQNPRFRASAAWVLGEVGARVPNGRGWLELLTGDADHNVTYRAGLAARKLEEQLSQSIRLATG